MGFKSFPFSCWVALYIVIELWIQCVTGVNGALDESGSHEHLLPFYDSHNHLNEHEHYHEDGYCDCNSQGPWRPLFKPSQEDLPDPESLHQLNNLDASHEQLHELADDLHQNIHTGERQAKKQNHMIHLHLIPHIYVPVVHPVTYSVHENNEHKTTPELNDFHTTHTTEPNLSSEEYKDHSQEQEPEHFYQDNHLHLPNQNFDSGHHDFSEHLHGHGHSHEHQDLNNVHNGFYYPPQYVEEPHYPPQHIEEHQYQVHEEANRDPFYGNFATGSNDDAHVLPINNNLNFNFFNAKKNFADRSRYNKRYLDFPKNMIRLRVMRPPTLGQKNTWVMNFPHNAFPAKTMFDVKPYTIKPPIFDFKPFMKPMNSLQSPGLPLNKILQPSVHLNKFMQGPIMPMNKLIQNPGILPMNKLVSTPMVVYPTDTNIKRSDKATTKSTKSTVGTGN